jgi:hypothetical protein
MSARRAIPMFLSVAILLLTGGECVTPLFANQQSKQCCARGMCQRSRRSSQKKDPCCQTTPPTATQYFEVAAKTTIDRAPVVVASVVSNGADFSRSSLSFRNDGMAAAFQWPPGSLPSVSLPLLV